MAVSHRQSGRKKSGGRTRRNRKLRKYDIGSKFSQPKLGGEKVEKKRTRGGNSKQIVREAEKVNLAADGEVEQVEIEAVLENPANSNFVRRSLLTKGTVVRTPEGKARITSRPGQDGVVNAELIEE